MKTICDIILTKWYLKDDDCMHCYAQCNEHFTVAHHKVTGTTIRYAKNLPALLKAYESQMVLSVQIHDEMEFTYE